MKKKIRGVNLGGWLVLEKWMSPNLFQGTTAADEYYLAIELPKDEYQARILTHRGEFITEADFLNISTAGFNLIRIPVPYFIFGDCAPFLGCLTELDKAFKWAEAYDLKLLIDLHTVPYSQNGFDNGGLSGVVKWAQKYEEVEYALSVLARLAERYCDAPALWGIEVINEPITEPVWETMNPLVRYKARDAKIAEGSAPITLEFLRDFYVNAYNQMRIYLPEDKVIVFHDGFQLHAWKQFFAEHSFRNIMLDTHQYVMMAELNGIAQNLAAYLTFIKGLGAEIAEVAKYVRIFVGEWSLFNSYAVGADTQGGINPIQQTFAKTNAFTKKQLEYTYQELWRYSVAAWNEGEGHFYWTYKLNIDTINEPEWYGWDSWDISRAIAKNWIDSKYA